MNTVFECPGWTVYRQLGIGDRQHVRSGLMSIGMPSIHQIDDQLTAAYHFGDTIKMMVRPHLFIHQLILDDASLYDRCVSIAHQNLTHQFEPHDVKPSVNRSPVFDMIMANCELVIVPTLNQRSKLSDLKTLLLWAWHSTGERILNGNFSEQSVDALRVSHSTFFHDSTIFWDSFNANSKRS